MPTVWLFDLFKRNSCDKGVISCPQQIFPLKQWSDFVCLAAADVKAFMKSVKAE